MARLPKYVTALLGPENEWPVFTEAQVEWLEKAFPARCILAGESLEEHLRYAGAVDLIGAMRARVLGSSGAEGLAMDDDELEALSDAEVYSDVVAEGGV